MADFLLDIKETSEILGKENINCLISLFNEIDGKPPCVNKKRYRVNNPDQISVLDYLEQSAHLITTKTIETKQFYYLRPYAIPLIKKQKAQKLLQLMCKIYESFAGFYKERLDESVTRDEILQALDVPYEEALEALSYFHDTHSVHTGWGNGFPYEEGSHINISEDVLLKESFLEVLTDYYRWHFINQKDEKSKEHIKKEISPPKIKIENKKTGRPSLKEKIIEAYEFLKKEGSIDYSKTLKSHTEIIQKTVQAQNPEITGTAGMAHEAIRRAISKHFQTDKNNL